MAIQPVNSRKELSAEKATVNSVRNMMTHDYKKYFPYKKSRDCQDEAIQFILDAFLKKDKKFAIIEAGTGVGKSAIGLTAAKYTHSALVQEEGYEPGSHFLTTQKILQDQYVQDFGPLGMSSIKSSTNYSCKSHRGSTCGEGLRLLKGVEKGSKVWNTCVFKCPYKRAKRNYIASSEGVTNFAYFLAETMYAGKILPRNVLVIDEAHNTDIQLSKFIEVAITEKFCKEFLGLAIPKSQNQIAAHAWIKDVYTPKVRSKFEHMESILDKYVGMQDKIKEFSDVMRKYELLDKHLSKLRRFLDVYEDDNWIYNLVPADNRKSARIEFKPIDVAPFADDYIFRYGKKVIMMSATILDKGAFCQSLGIDLEDAEFITMPSPFPLENRPIMAFPIGNMNYREIDRSLPKLAAAIKEILKNHKGEKGIIHAHSYKIASYIQKHVRSTRLIFHNSENREEMLKKHMRSKKSTVLVSPSMTEGVDLRDDNSRFQIICKIPYPYLGDELVKKRMKKWPWWYPLQTAKSIVQSVGRSIRSEHDHAVTYILDSDWEPFYRRNKPLFPPGFTSCLK